MEYAASVWDPLVWRGQTLGFDRARKARAVFFKKGRLRQTRDPHQQYLIDNIEKIQRRAARWVLSDYRQQSSVTNMLNQLHWPTLQLRRYVSRLSQIHKIVYHHNTAINMPSYYMPTTCLLHAYIISNQTITYISIHHSVYFHHQLPAKLLS